MRYEKRWGILALCAVSVGFFWYQHSCGLYWDFMAYVLNARHMLGGSYFEWMRPPLIPLLLAPFMLMGVAGEYFFIAFSMVCFTYGIVRLARVLNIREDLFLLFIFQPLFFIYGALEGSELLSAGLFSLFLAYVITNNRWSGLFLGLGMVARYNIIYFIPLIFFLRKKRIPFALLLASFPLLAWMIVNLLATGNLFTSLADNIALNKIFRESVGSFPWKALFLILWAPLLLAVFGVGRSWKRKDTVMALALAIIFFVYASTPLKVERYLFFSIIPFAYFATKTMRSPGRIIAGTGLLLIASIISFSVLTSVCGAIPKGDMKEMTAALDGPVMSDGWVHLNYLGIDAVPKPSEEALHYFLLSGRKAAIFKNYFHEPEPNNTSGYPILWENDGLLVLGIEGWDAAPLPLDMTYLELRSLDRKIASNSEFDPDPCKYVIQNKLFIAACRWLHETSSMRDYANEVISASDHPFSRLYLDTDKRFCQEIPEMAPDLTLVQEALRHEQRAALGCGIDRTQSLAEGALIWEKRGEVVRSSILKSLKDESRPFPPFSSSYYSAPKPQGRYCDLEGCDIPKLAFQSEGHWFLPGSEGTYKYRIANTSVYKETNFFLSESIVQVTGLEDIMVIS